MTGDIVNRLRTNRECLAPCLMDEAADEIVRLEAALVAATQERDEARREVCRHVFLNGGVPPRQYAKAKNWDCFSPENP
jgi:hypothetical protein